MRGRAPILTAVGLVLLAIASCGGYDPLDPHELQDVCGMIQLAVRVADRSQRDLGSELQVGVRGARRAASPGLRCSQEIRGCFPLNADGSVTISGACPGLWDLRFDLYDERSGPCTLDSSPSAIGSCEALPADRPVVLEPGVNTLDLDCRVQPASVTFQIELL